METVIHTWVYMSFVLGVAIQIAALVYGREMWQRYRKTPATAPTPTPAAVITTAPATAP